MSDGTNSGGRWPEPTVAFLLSQLGTQAGIRFGEAVAPLGLTQPQAGIIFTLAHHDCVSQRFLASRFGVVPARIVVLVDELEAMGIVERTSVDRRTYAVCLTKKGKAMVKSLHKLAAKLDQEFFSSLAEDETEVLRATLKKLVTSERLTEGIHPGYRLMGRRPMHIPMKRSDPELKRSDPEPDEDATHGSVQGRSCGIS